MSEQQIFYSFFIFYVQMCHDEKSILGPFIFTDLQMVMIN